MDDIFLKKFKRLDDEVWNQKEELARSKLEFVKMEKELKENQEKIAELEKKTTLPPVCQCQCKSDHYINETEELKRKVTVFEQQFEDVKSKCGSLSKLQVFLNKAMMKSQKSAHGASRIGELQTEEGKTSQDIKGWQLALGGQQQQQTELIKLRQDVDAWQLALGDHQQQQTELIKLRQDVDAWQLTLVDYQQQQTELIKLRQDVDAWQLALVDYQQQQAELIKLRQDFDDMQDASKKNQAVQGTSVKLSQEKKVSIQTGNHIYYTSHSSWAMIFQKLSIFKCKDFSQWGTLVSAQPLTPDCASFSIEILQCVQQYPIEMGVNYSKDPKSNNVIYSSGGNIFIVDGKDGTNTYEVVPQCWEGDTMKCQLDFEGRNITFFLNNVLVYTGTMPCQQTCDLHSLHPRVHMVNASVKPLEREPWRR